MALIHQRLERIPMRRRPLSVIRVLYVDLNGQSPRHLEQAGRKEGWIWLGSHVIVDRRTGRARASWYGEMTKARQRHVEDFLTLHADRIPQNPYEWDTLGGM